MYNIPLILYTFYISAWSEDDGADWSDRLQEGEDVVPRPQGGLVVSKEGQVRSGHATECRLTDPRR